MRVPTAAADPTTCSSVSTSTGICAYWGQRRQQRHHVSISRSGEVSAAAGVCLHWTGILKAACCLTVLVASAHLLHSGVVERFSLYLLIGIQTLVPDMSDCPMVVWGRCALGCWHCPPTAAAAAAHQQLLNTAAGSQHGDHPYALELLNTLLDASLHGTLWNSSITIVTASRSGRSESCDSLSPDLEHDSGTVLCCVQSAAGTTRAPEVCSDIAETAGARLYVCIHAPASTVSYDAVWSCRTT